LKYVFFSFYEPLASQKCTNRHWTKLSKRFH
jgi:hypothetical protein